MDRLNKKAQPDRSKINMHQPFEVKYWTHALGVSKKSFRRRPTMSANRRLLFVNNSVSPMDIETKDSAAECAREARKQVALLAPGKVRDALVEKAKQYEAEVSEADTGH